MTEGVDIFGLVVVELLHSSIQSLLVMSFPADSTICLQVIFVATGNRLSEIPAPLLDRLEVISLPGYTQDEKVHIAQVSLSNLITSSQLY